MSKITITDVRQPSPRGRGVSDHQCRRAAMRRIVEHAGLRVTDAAAYDETMRALVERWRYYDGRIAARAALMPLATFAIVTDSGSEELTAYDADDAARKYAAGQGWRGIVTADDLRDYVADTGGWGTMTGPDGRHWTVAR